MTVFRSLTSYLLSEEISHYHLATELPAHDEITFPALS